MREALGLLGVVQQQAAEVIEVRAKVIAFRLADHIDLIDAVGEQNVVELVKAPETVVAFERRIPAEFPPAAQRELTLGFDAATPAVKISAVFERRW